MKKGFTLIELLAVILILGIIALIAIPTVNNILKESRRGAFQSTLTNLEKAVEEKCTTEQIKNQEITTEYIITNGVISPKLDIKGSLPDGNIYVNNQCIVSYFLSDNNFIASKEFDGEVVINEKGFVPTKYTESILNGTDPVLSDDLIPVTIKDDGTVKEANLYSKWYSYAEKKWANAVILTEDGKIEEDGTILEDSIESYFVWIPRYKYKLFDKGEYNSYITGKPSESSAGPIEIIFENKNTPVSVGVEVDDYHSHPAFQAFDSNGLWVGKFETGGTLNEMKIKPNITSIRSTGIKNMFEKSLVYKENIETHMMTNIEWGAVAYLSLSDYGINHEININNNSDYLTGYSATSNANVTVYPSTTGTTVDITMPYNTEVGYKASTTGNITGIYDMSGGAEEYVTSYADKSLGTSGFSDDPVSLYGNQYFQKYPQKQVFSYYNRTLGDATGEVGPFYYYKEDDNQDYIHGGWYNDYSYMVDYGIPWMVRGGKNDDGQLSGILAFSRRMGSQSNYTSFRMVLVS